MIDCGANAPLGLKRAGISLSSVDAIAISHCHGDHFGGLPFLIMSKMFLTRDVEPFRIIGPPQIEHRATSLMNCLYPGLLDVPRAFPLSFTEIQPETSLTFRDLTITAHEVFHPSGSPSLAFSITDGSKRFAFSGDSGWCDGLNAAGKDADLFLIECTSVTPTTPVHLDYNTLAQKFDEFGAKRYALTHMGEDMLAFCDQVDRSRCILADDGMVIEIE